jgi:hypothetical protein
VSKPEVRTNPRNVVQTKPCSRCLHEASDHVFTVCTAKKIVNGAEVDCDCSGFREKL